MGGLECRLEKLGKSCDLWPFAGLTASHLTDDRARGNEEWLLQSNYLFAKFCFINFGDLKLLHNLCHLILRQLVDKSGKICPIPYMYNWVYVLQGEQLSLGKTVND